MKRLMPVLLCFVLIPAVAFAEVVQVYIFHANHSGATASQFRVVPPPYATHAGDVWSVPYALGTSISGVSLGYGTCLNAPVYLGYATFIMASVTCADFGIVADPSSLSGQIEAVDCSGTLVFPDGYDFRLDYDPCRVPGPAGTLPPDGAVGVQLDPTLTWTWYWNDNCPEGIGIPVFSVYLGTDPGELELAGSGDLAGELSVGPLQAATTYYWNVKVRDEVKQCPGLKEQWSPVYSFTTEGTIPVEPTTWGRIKSLYR